jgi:FAD/FMN-containing dehydrogenase
MNDAISQIDMTLAELSSTIEGRVITPEHGSYDEARQVFYGGFDARPSLIVKAATARDVARVVSLAGESGLELAVRSGGHSLAGHGVSEGGIVLDLSEMKGLDIDVEGRTAWAEAGLTAAEYTNAVGVHGLATGFGDAGSVGIGGITLGGGVGFLARKHGLTIDSLLAAEVVTADGLLLHADEGNHPDLFWAIRGGGGNFGVATRFHFRLHDVESFYGGILILPATPEVIAGYVVEAQNAPEELSGIANVMTAPPMPFLPEEVHGQLVMMSILAYVGPADEGERTIDRFRDLATPIADMVGPRSYPEMYMPEEEGLHPLVSGRNLFLDGFDQTMAETAIDHIGRSTAMMSVTQLRVLGGAMGRVPSEATAFAHRDRALMVNVGAIYEDPADAATHEAWVDGLATTLSQGSTGAYVGFLGDEGESRVQEAYPGKTWDRLRDIKLRYDPTNLFHLNQNIPPSA